LLWPAPCLKAPVGYDCCKFRVGPPLDPAVFCCPIRLHEFVEAFQFARSVQTFFWGPVIFRILPFPTFAGFGFFTRPGRIRSLGCFHFVPPTMFVRAPFPPTAVFFCSRQPRPNMSTKGFFVLEKTAFPPPLHFFYVESCPRPIFPAPPPNVVPQNREISRLGRNPRPRRTWNESRKNPWRSPRSPRCRSVKTAPLSPE